MTEKPAPTITMDDIILAAKKDYVTRRLIKKAAQRVATAKAELEAAELTLAHAKGGRYGAVETEFSKIFSRLHQQIMTEIEKEDNPLYIVNDDADFKNTYPRYGSFTPAEKPEEKTDD